MKFLFAKLRSVPQRHTANILVGADPIELLLYDNSRPRRLSKYCLYDMDLFITLSEQLYSIPPKFCIRCH
jgi:hypothetical protein